MKRRKYRRSNSNIVAKNYPKSKLLHLPCFKKTIYPSEAEAEKGATIIWGKDPTAKREDLHAYRCPDGCLFNGVAAWHVGHKSFYIIHQERQGILHEST